MNLNTTTMINPKIENAHTELCKAINANRHSLGEGQTYHLLNLADTLANEGDDSKTSQQMVLKATSRRLMYLQERLRTDQQLIAAQLKAWNTTE